MSTGNGSRDYRDGPGSPHPPRREVVEVPSIPLRPCGHLVDAPTTSSATITCHCGRRYRLVRDHETWKLYSL